MTRVAGSARAPLLEVSGVLGQLPPVRRIEQRMQPRGLASVSDALLGQLNGETARSRVQPGDRVAITVGSRGISHLPEIVATLVAWLRSLDARPFVVPAMGSHGAGTAEGQARVLASLGVDEAGVGAPVDPSMDTVRLGSVRGGGALEVDVFTARSAWDASAVIPVGRVKPHTDFGGPVQSGVLKMLALGLGKHEGARSLHQVPGDYFSELLARAAELVLRRLPVVFGVAVVEDSFEQPAIVEVVPAERLGTREPELLALAGEWMPRLPFHQVDVLLVDEIGKNISGTGMDPNVTGRFYRPGRSTTIEIARIVVLSLAEASHGNACGIGMADVVCSRAAEQVDWYATYANELAARLIEGARLPLVAQADDEAVAIAVSALSLRRPADVRLAWIRNTLELSEMVVSEPLWAEVRDDERLRALGEPAPLRFVDGVLLP